MTSDNQTKRAQMAHVTNLISMARIDGKLTQSEYDYILAIAKELGLSQAELDQCMKDSDNLVIEVPQNEEDKIEYMKSLFNMTFTEGTVDKQKRSFVEHIYEKFGYNGKEAFDIIYDDFMEKYDNFTEKEKASEPAGNNEMTEEEFREELQRRLQKSAECFMKNDMPGVFDQLHYAAMADLTARRMFLRIPDYVYPMFMLTDRQVDELKKLSDEGDAVSRYTLGRYYQLVRPSRDNLKKARELFEASAEQGLSEAICGLALLARDGFYEEADQDRYKALMSEAGSKGSPKALSFLWKDRIYGLNGQDANPQMVIDRLTAMFKDATGDENKDIFDFEPEAYDLLGRAYQETGQTDKAANAYIQAVSMGYFEALSRLALLNCCDADGNIVDKEMFEHYIKIGVENNDAWSFAMRGILGEEGYDDLTPDEQVRRTSEIKADLEKACVLGDNNAPAILGRHYYYGTNGFAEDDEAAWKWFNIGSAYSSSECYSMMAQMISEGHCPKKVSEKFHAFCILCAYRFGDESKLEDVIKAYRSGLLDDFRNEIERYYLPKCNNISQSCLDDIADMEITDVWS